MIQVLQPGMFTTVQDLGRYGYGPLGVSPSGAADPISLRIGNLLVGNPECAAALEMTLLGGKFVFPEGALIALTGSDFGASIPMYTATVLAPGERLDIGPTRSGARCYLCVHGGIAVEPLLGSASTHILTGLGGLEGRALKKGDVLQVGPSHEIRPKTIVLEALAKLHPRKILRTTIAPQTAWFSAVSTGLVLQERVASDRRIQPHGLAPRRPRAGNPTWRPDDLRRRLARRNPDSRRRPSHHSFRRAANHRRLSENR